MPLLDLLHPADIGQPHAGRGRPVDADLGEWLVAGPLVEQFVGRVGHDVCGRHRGLRRASRSTIRRSAAGQRSPRR